MNISTGARSFPFYTTSRPNENLNIDNFYQTAMAAPRKHDQAE